MKIQGAKKIHYDSGPNMTPLVDIVMVILIFLMLAGSFGTAEHYLVSDLPVQVKGAGGKPPLGSVIPPVTIHISREGSQYIVKAGNFVSIRGADPVQVGDQLKSQLAAQFKNLKQAKVNTDDVQVIIYPEQNVILDALVPAFEAANDAGFQKVGFGIEQK